MLAVNYGFIEFTKLLISHGAEIKMKDSFNFTPLLYSVKSEENSLFFYLLYLGSNLSDVDQNNCSCIHWAAYKNNIFLL